MDKAFPPLRLGLAGFGTVGGGLARILEENRETILARTGRRIEIATVLVRDASRPRKLPDGARLTADPDALVTDPTLDVVVELMGGIDAAQRLIQRALQAGKHVVTANKALLAETGNQLFALAAERNLHLAYEASVCGGIPVVQTLRESLAANNILSLVGILNGTSNYILSEMSTKGVDFDQALGQAQERGYAEADPTLDIEGIDAAHKLALLIRLAWGVEYPFAHLPVRGIRGMAAEDIQYAREFGCRIKLLGQARMVDGRIEAGVFPALVHETFLLARVGGAYNALRVEGDAVGSVFLHGKGAGDLPTGSAVAADILAIARNALPNNTGYARPALPPRARLIPEAEARGAFYLRMLVPDAPGILRDVASIMAENDISIAQVIQKGRHNAEAGEPCVPLIVLTHEVRASGVARALSTLTESRLVKETPVHFRVLSKQE